MKETGIMMSGNHPKLVLDGLKTQTRRTYGLEKLNKNPGKVKFLGVVQNGYYQFDIQSPLDIPSHGYIGIKCPYGQVGDRLWVRETWARFPQLNEMMEGIGFKADIDKCGQVPVGNTLRTWGKVKTLPSIHMFKKDARIWLEITEVRVERLQEITEGDAIKEGIKPIYFTTGKQVDTLPRFRYLWNSINAKRGYGHDTNPWVWVISFLLYYQGQRR